jgi:hypothetical protein
VHSVPPYICVCADPSDYADFSRSLTRDFGFESQRVIDARLFVSLVCCQVKLFALGLLLVQWDPAECVVSDCDRKALIIVRPWPTGGGWVMETKICFCLPSLIKVQPTAYIVPLDVTSDVRFLTFCRLQYQQGGSKSKEVR